jgi:hypothetical protein
VKDSFLQHTREAGEGLFHDVARDGTNIYGAYSREPSSDWTTLVAVPAAVGFESEPVELTHVVQAALDTIAPAPSPSAPASRRTSPSPSSPTPSSTPSPTSPAPPPRASSEQTSPPVGLFD